MGGGKAVSDTPRTDKILFTVDVCDGEDVVNLWFARNLERELNTAQDRIKRLEEAGDELFENSNPSRWDSLEAAAQKLVDQSNWIKAKESK